VAGAKPNIVVVLADDMGFSDLGCYGGEIETPTLDSLAESGLRFSRFSNTAKCHSSRISLLSGLWAYQAGNIALSKAATFPQLLNRAGYATAMVGKWHLKKTPHDFGFEKYFGHLSGASPFIEGNDTFLLNGEPYNEFGTTAEEFYLTDANTDYALEFLQEWRDGKAERPFLLYLAYNARTRLYRLLRRWCANIGVATWRVGKPCAKLASSGRKRLACSMRISVCRSSRRASVAGTN
jgi:arylsulfatase